MQHGGKNADAMTSIIVPTKKHPLANCGECPLYNQRCAPTAGPLDAKVAVVSRSPGKWDVLHKTPFAGESGKVLDHLLGLYGVNREEVITTNVVLCKTDDPPKEAINACRPRLESEIKNCTTVIAAGVEAVTELTGRKGLGGTRGYAHLRYSNGRTQRVIATNNPAIVLRDDSTFNNLVKDFGLALAPKPQPKLPQVRWTNNVAEAKQWIKSTGSNLYDPLAVDIETKGLRADADIVAIGFSADGSKAFSVGEYPLRDDDFFRNYITPFVSGQSKYLGHNYKFDVRNLRWHGINARVDHDTMLLSWALDERSDEEQVHRLEYLLMSEFGWPNYEPKEVVAYKSAVKRLEKELRFKELAALEVPDELYRYNALDAAGTAQLFPLLKQRAIDDNVYQVYKRYLIPAANALIKMELQGIAYNTEAAFDLLEEQVWPALNELKTQLQWIIGKGDYNPNSAPQNAALVYDEWNIQHGIRLPQGKERSVDKSVYTEIKAGRFVIGGGEIETKADRKETAIRWAEKFADFKALDKQRSTYIEGMIPVAIHNGDRLFTNFKLHNTVSARLSSSGPNLQNITRVKPELPNIRELFVASPGCTLLNADYSQAELRTIGKLSGDSEFRRVYSEGIDFHSLVAERFYGPGFTKENRQTAKNINFGVAYQQTPETFQEKHGIPVEEARPFVEWWWQNFPTVREWTNNVTLDVLKGEVVSPFGYKRRFPLITKENKNAAIREGINFLPQNIAAQLCLLALVELVNEFDFTIAAVLLNVHDSLLFDIRSDHLLRYAVHIKEVMESVAKRELGWTDIPFDVDLQIGPNWGNLEPYEINTQKERHG
jgi:DNA polymerase-1